MTKKIDPCAHCEYSYKEEGKSILLCNATEKEKKGEGCPYVPGEVIH